MHSSQKRHRIRYLLVIIALCFFTTMTLALQVLVHNLDLHTEAEHISIFNQAEITLPEVPCTPPKRPTTLLLPTNPRPITPPIPPTPVGPAPTFG